MKMPDKKNHNEQPDEFSKLIRQKLEDYRMPVEAGCWNEIELQMKPKQRKSVWWIGGSVAAIAVIVILLLSIPKNDEPPFNPVAGINNFNATDIRISKPEKQTATVTSTTNNDVLQLQAKRYPVSISGKTDKGKLLAEESNTLNESLPVTITDTINLAHVEEIVQEVAAENNNLAENNVNITDTISGVPAVQEKKPVEKTSKEPARLLIAKAENSNNKWLMSASVSSGEGSSSNGNMSKNLMYNSAASGNITESCPVYDVVSPILNRELDVNDISETDHSLPLSFGVNVRKDINRYIGIETGLTYTYLSSKFRKKTVKSLEARQELHYLGIPVNVVLYLWNSSKWNIYLSAGGMVEKGLAYKYTEDIYGNNGTAVVHGKGSISGLQWSLNASLGASYMFYNDWSIYFEPRFSYYFDNKQPISIRTEKHSVFGLGAGLRYKF
jgi:opacity protein-like surface antigen